AVRGPEQYGEHGVDQDGPRCPAHGMGRTGDHAAEALSEPPHRARPHDRRRQRGFDAGTPGDPEPEQNLDRRKGGVGGDRVVGDELGRPGYRVGECRRTTRWWPPPAAAPAARREGATPAARPSTPGPPSLQQTRKCRTPSPLDSLPPGIKARASR